MVTVAGPAAAAAQEAEAHPLDGSLVSVRVVGGFTPYRLVSYEVLWRARVAVAGHYRGLVNYSEAFHRMHLVPRTEYMQLLDDLAEDGVFELADAPPPPVRLGALEVEIEVKRGDRSVKVRVVGPDAQVDRRYAAVVQRVRAFVLKHAGDLAFRNVFFEPGTFGYVNLTSVPVSKVFVDGRDIHRETPVYGYELPAGQHEVRLVAAKEGYERTHTLRVEAGMTTIVHFDLR